jgi:AcrR family transcriptional regulator
MVSAIDPVGARPRPYHIGHVRETLLKDAGVLLRAGGLPNLSLRALSTRSDIALGSVYHHFTSKDDLLAALAAQGFVDLRQGVTEAIEGSVRGVLRKSAVAYFDFSRREPEVYALMFESRVARTPPVRYERAVTYQVFEDAIAAARIAQGRAGETTPAMLTAIWAAIHGAALLSMADENGERIIETTILGLEEMLRPHR